MIGKYDHQKLEGKWQAAWEKSKIFNAKDPSIKAKLGAGQAAPEKPKFYSLIEFPYPSGDGLHVGHPRPYIGMDVISRKKRMEGYNVLYPIGWDAFGLPTENYAIKTGKDPRAVTKENTDTFRRQIKSLGISFDWGREINTTDPKYYKWTQWLFLQFLKHGLAYKAKMSINWCPACKIGLANEEVINGACERCGHAVEKREKEQWMLAITKYADRLYKDLDGVDYLPQIKLGQRNWIGRSEGAEIKFQVLVEKNSDFITVFTTRADTIFGATYLVLAPEHPLLRKILNSQYPISNKKEIEEYIKEAKTKTEVERAAVNKSKTGVELKGVKAVNPASKEEISVWVADYVLSTYGTGAIMAVPAHDERDLEFAKKYNLPIRNVIEPLFLDKIDPEKPFVEREAVSVILKHWKEDKYLVLKWKGADWFTFITGGIERDQTPEGAAIAEILEETGYLHPQFVQSLPKTHAKFYHVIKKENRFAHFYNFYFELRDGESVERSEREGKARHEPPMWLGPEEVKKVLTAEGHRRDWQYLKEGQFAYNGAGILANSGDFTGMDSETAKKEIVKFVGGKEKTSFKLRDWVFSRQRYWGEPIPVIFCEHPASTHGNSSTRGGCGVVPVPDEDLPVELPKVKNYQPTDSGESPLADIAKWVNVKCPKCGRKARRETDTMPNWAGSSWYYLAYCMSKKAFRGLASADNWKLEIENLKYFMPVDWYNGGMEHTTLHLLYSRFWHKFLYDLELVPSSEPYLKRTAHGLIMASGGEKMSKSKGNVINPDDIVRTYGADTLRVYEMFMGPFNQAIAWSDEAIIGPRRFLERVWKIGIEAATQKQKNPSRFTRQNPPGSDATQDSFVSAPLVKLLHKTIKKVSEDIDSMNFNTAISALMICASAMEKEKPSREEFMKFLQLLSPFAPHLAEELWGAMGEKESIGLSAWPSPDPALLEDAEVKIVVQINGKVRSEVMVAKNSGEETVREKALLDEKVLKHTKGANPKKVIYVKNRLINILI